MKFLYTEHEGGEWVLYENEGIGDVGQLERMVSNEDNWVLAGDVAHMTNLRTRIGDTLMHAIMVSTGAVYDSCFRKWSARYTSGHYEYQMGMLE